MTRPNESRNSRNWQQCMNCVSDTLGRQVGNLLSHLGRVPAAQWKRTVVVVKRGRGGGLLAHVTGVAWGLSGAYSTTSQ